MFHLTRALLPILLIFGLTACSSTEEVPPTTIALSITNDAPEAPVVEEVQLGSTITLEVSSSTDGVLHVHGYEKELQLVAGETVVETFKASMVGAFEMETHEPAAVWVKLVVS